MSHEKEKEICDFDTSSETQGQMVWARQSLNGREKMVRRKVKNGEKVLSFSSAPECPRMISTWILRNLFCCCSNLSNDDIIS